MLQDCFQLGTAALLEALPAILAGTVSTSPQREEEATAAPKLSANESLVDFASMTARQIHNKCRAFSEWPGISAVFALGGEPSSTTMTTMKVKILTTCLLEAATVAPSLSKCSGAAGEVLWLKGLGVMAIRCRGEGQGEEPSWLGIKEVKPENKKQMDTKSFVNGLRGNLSIRWLSPSSGHAAANK